MMPSAWVIAMTKWSLIFMVVFKVILYCLRKTSNILKKIL